MTRTPSYAVPNTQAGDVPSSPNLYVGDNTIGGIGEGGTTIDSRFFCVSGTSGAPAIVENNAIDHCHRLGHLIGSYVTFRKNRFGMAYHHGFTGTDLDDTYITDVRFENNVFWCDRGASGTNSTSAAIQLGYNHRVFVNNFQVVGNTFDGWKYGAFDFNDVVDLNGPTLATNVVVSDNIIANGAYAFTTYHSATIPWNCHVLECDYNVLYNQATAMATTGTNGLTNRANPTAFYQGSSKYNRLASAQPQCPVGRPV